ncbi:MULTISPECIES: hypothetical protein [unclassified Sphingopyxis]|jgi:hypothetical protein|uniref:hypothetical protein n=1 Tax=Sphingopyxis sp. DBS4 TaxID=2968500 RepID=UPI00214B1784|nr:hypothetical protein [Sphingopyxis sp. DBS4]
MGRTPWGVKRSPTKILRLLGYGIQMGCEVPIIKDVEPPSQLELLERGARLRSDLLDAFARLEEVVCKKLDHDAKGTAAQSLTQKLNALEKASFRHPIKAKQRIAEIRALVECRNDMVHSILAVAELSSDSNSYFVFRNVSALPDCTGRQLRAITSEEFKALISRVKTAAKQLSDQPMKATAPTAPAAATA